MLHNNSSSCSVTDAPTRYTEDGWSDYSVLPSVYRDVRGSVLPSTQWIQQSPSTYHGENKVLSYAGCLCPTDCPAGEALRRQHQHSHQNQLTKQSMYLYTFEFVWISKTYLSKTRGFDKSMTFTLSAMPLYHSEIFCLSCVSGSWIYFGGS